MATTDGDKHDHTQGRNWDIVTGVGYTALGVCAQRAIETERPDALIHDPYAKSFVLAAGDPDLIDMVTGRSAPESSPWAELRAMGLRSRFFDEYLLDAADAGVRQMVILAAGLDARAHRLPWPPGVRVFELDQPLVLAFKDAVYAQLRATPASQRHTVAVDLRDRWPSALQAAGFDPFRPTAWAAEGLLPYLPAPAQDLLFERIAALSAPGSFVAVEGPRGELGTEQFAAIERKYHGVFGTIDIADLFHSQEKIPPVGWLTERGWQVREYNPLQLTERYELARPPIPPDVYELACEMQYVIGSLPR
ncbi:class I SAM-dependent methyltransferase [Mycobacteroides abscessus]|uniref:class I SAM-dependent methyltransferase n=1 Tax=Mycobacteroides abscessus TaxID=36809 RepID=UPI0009A80A5F|nr:class I SAM-dependent methyltransferase [Mycobacteroides abscessus]SKI12624.1 S-adenosyl-L-methionine-dependent methyltransferase [Mycobacteroides abscessus subsp. massiliense]SKM20071.1 S-adenosyl-L-methionine-dependent methyltransferase [Mycobacteroides abscessus subsp. massiliense]